MKHGLMETLRRPGYDTQGLAPAPTTMRHGTEMRPGWRLLLRYWRRRLEVGHTSACMVVCKVRQCLIIDCHPRHSPHKWLFSASSKHARLRT